MKRRATTLTTITLALLLTGCSTFTEGRAGYPADTNPDTIFEFTRDLTDGRTVTCIGYNNAGFAGGVSCDWEGAEQTSHPEGE